MKESTKVNIWGTWLLDRYRNQTLTPRFRRWLHLMRYLITLSFIKGHCHKAVDRFMIIEVNAKYFGLTRVKRVMCELSCTCNRVFWKRGDCG